MTDIHSHLIYDIDDGAKTIEESIELIKKMQEIGFKNLIITPHYIDNSEYSVNNSEKIKRLNTIKDEVKKQKININLYLGNEIYINHNIVDKIKDKQISTLNGSKYFLFELPFHNQILNLSDIIYEMKIAGLIPILAHPERYDYFQKNYKLLDELKKEGLLFQVNYASIIDYYGKKSKKLMKYLLKKGYVDYLATDIHHISSTIVFDNFDKIEKKIINIIGEENYQKILKNADNILKEESIFN